MSFRTTWSMVSDFGSSYLIHAFSGLPSLDQSESSLSSIVLRAVSVFDPAVTLTASRARRVWWKDSPRGVGPRPRKTGRPADRNVVDSPPVLTNGFESMIAMLPPKPSEFADNVIFPAVVVERIITRFTPPSTGRLFERM